MIILSIETSCDETAVSIVDADGDFPHATYTIRGNALWSQIDVHREYGGVFPALAKREHAATLVPMLDQALTEAKLPHTPAQPLTDALKTSTDRLLEREPGLAEKLHIFCKDREVPNIDLIAVTSGPGLEPALWVGINFAKALALLWDVPLIPVDHMEGHIFASLFDLPAQAGLSTQAGGGQLPTDLTFPAISLLISGGHTELVAMHAWPQHGDTSPTYAIIGKTRDDAVGEAFDKVARLMDLPYPGGPEISRLAAEARKSGVSPSITLPRPMLDSDDLDFSFSGIKTAVRYAIEKLRDEHGALSPEISREIALEFENAVTEVLLKKTQRAIEELGAQSLILGGGVTANSYIREQFEAHFGSDTSGVTLYLPDPKLSTDNSIMIALAGHAHAGEAQKPEQLDAVRADGNQSLANK